MTSLEERIKAAKERKDKLNLDRKNNKFRFEYDYRALGLETLNKIYAHAEKEYGSIWQESGEWFQTIEETSSLRDEVFAITTFLESQLKEE